MKGVVIYTIGLTHCLVCAPEDMSLEVLEHAVNTKHPTGIELPWRVSDEPTFSGGEPNPCPCGDTPSMLHYLMVC